MNPKNFPRKKVVAVEHEREDGHDFYYNRLECGHRVLIPVHTRPRRKPYTVRPCADCALAARLAALNLKP